MATCAPAFQMPAMALLDTDGVYGAPAAFTWRQKKMGIKAHIGAEVYMPVLCPCHPERSTCFTK